MKTALILIDVQVGIDDAAHWGGNRNNPAAEENISLLLQAWRASKLPVVIIQHASVSPISPLRPGQQGHALKPLIVPRENERVITKSTANAFIGTSLQKHLLELECTQLVITGFVTNNSVEATARMAGDLGYKTIVVSDATACFDKQGLTGAVYSSAVVHELSLANLKDEYATIVDTQTLLKKIKSDNL
jgi:nicotinamidase-related amidase